MNLSMEKWPKQHKQLLCVIVALLFLCLGYGYVRLRPNWLAYSELRDEKESLESKLNKSEWPRDSERLQALLRDYEKRLKKDNGRGTGLVEETKTILNQATNLYVDRVVREYGSVADFKQRASQTEYKDQYDKLDTYLQGKGILLEPAIFGMNELTNEPFKYQMLLKLWTVQSIVDCALENGLRVTQHRMPGGGRGRGASNISVLPMRSYVVEEGDADSYLLEFPVQMELRGSLDSFAHFADSLFTEGRFLPLCQMELVSVVPMGRNGIRPDSQGQIRSSGVVARIVCSSFFLQEADSVKKTVSPVKGSGTSGQRPAGI